MHSDSSILLYSSLSIFSPTPSSPPPSSPIIIPPLSSSACFLRLQVNPNSSDGRVLFVVTGPHNGGSAVLLRFWILQKNQVFCKVKVNCSQKDLICDDKFGVVANISHGLSVKIAGSVNVFALHSISARKIWVLAAKTIGEDDDRISVNLMKCAVIDPMMPFFSITVSSGFLVLGEENGVRVFPLRPLVKGRAKRQSKSTRTRENNIPNGNLEHEIPKSRESYLPNGAILTDNEINDGTTETYSKFLVNCPDDGKDTALEGSTEISSNGRAEKAAKRRGCEKIRTVKLNQDAVERGSCFMAFKSSEIQSLDSKITVMPLKTVSIHALSPKKFLVLDSVGDVHVLSLYNTIISETAGHMRRLNQTMKVQMLAVLPDISTRTQIVWISDGIFSVHMMTVSDMDIPVKENEKNDREEKLLQISVTQAIFASEKIQDMIPIAANGVLILGQGAIFAYAIS